MDKKKLVFEFMNPLMYIGLVRPYAYIQLERSASTSKGLLPKISIDELILGISINGLLPGIYVNGILPNISFNGLLPRIPVNGLLPRISVNGLLPRILVSELLLVSSLKSISSGRIYQPRTTSRSYYSTHKWGSYHYDPISINRWYRGVTTQPILFPTNLPNNYPQ